MTRRPHDPMRILIIDDDPDHREIMRRSLESCTPPYHVETTDSAADGLRRLAEGPFSLLLLDYNLHETDGLSVLKDLAERFPRLPTILVTGGGSEAVAAKAIKSGAYDYVVKDPNYALLRSKTGRGASRRVFPRRSVGTRVRAPLVFPRGSVGTRIKSRHRTSSGLRDPWARHAKSES